MRVNYHINAPFVRVKKEGENLGVMSKEQAQMKAREYGLDLVEIAPQAKPPVCIIVDFQKYLYDQKKKNKKQVQKPADLKEVRFRPVSGEHDINVKIDQIKKFLTEKRAVVINVFFKNKREFVFKDQGFQVIKNVISKVVVDEKLGEIGKLESYPRFEGKNIRAKVVPI